MTLSKNLVELDSANISYYTRLWIKKEGQYVKSQALCTAVALVSSVYVNIYYISLCFYCFIGQCQWNFSIVS
jgi:hypothetical protein